MPSDDESEVAIVSPRPGSNESESGHIDNYMMINILWHFHAGIHILTGDTTVMDERYDSVTIHPIKKPFAQSAWFLRLPGELIYQLKFCVFIWRLRHRLDLIIIDSSGFVIPNLWAKLLGLTNIYRIGGFIQFQEDTKSSHLGNPWVRILHSVQHIMYWASDTIVVISPSVVEFGNLGKYEDKIKTWCYFYFDFDLFDMSIPYTDRQNVIGQVGIMSEVKGSEQFITAIRQLDEETDTSLTGLMIGDGPLYERITNSARKKNIPVEFTGRVPRTEVAEEMNRIKLLIISSTTEGGPKVAWEAMACGTPVLSTKVGMIEDFVEEGTNGFLLESNDPSHISSRIVEILSRDDLPEISTNARKTAIENFSYRSAVVGYKELLEQRTTIQPPDMNEINLKQIDPHFQT